LSDDNQSSYSPDVEMNKTLFSVLAWKSLECDVQQQTSDRSASMRRKPWFIFFFVLVSVFSAYAEGPAVVVLTSGNRMTGSVSEFSRGNLEFSVDGAGTIDIDWGNVASLESTQDLDVELSSGERAQGQIVSIKGDKLEVKTTNGITSLEKKNVVRIMPVSATFAERTSGSVDLGFNFFQAQDEGNLTLHAEAEHKSHKSLTNATFFSLLNRRDDADLETRNKFTLGSRRYLGNKNFVLGEFEVHESTQLDIDSRILAKGAFGRTLVQNNRQIFAIYGGLDYDREQYAELAASQSSGEALGSLEWDIFKSGGKTELETHATTYVSFARARVRLELDTSLRRNLSRNYYWNIHLFEDFDSNPPTAVTHQNDFGIAVGIGRSF
jgi:hypothetical protein